MKKYLILLSASIIVLSGCSNKNNIGNISNNIDTDSSENVSHTIDKANNNSNYGTDFMQTYDATKLVPDSGIKSNNVKLSGSYNYKGSNIVQIEQVDELEQITDNEQLDKLEDTNSSNELADNDNRESAKEVAGTNEIPKYTTEDLNRAYEEYYSYMNQYGELIIPDGMSEVEVLGRVSYLQMEIKNITEYLVTSYNNSNDTNDKSQVEVEDIDETSYPDSTENIEVDTEDTHESSNEDNRYKELTSVQNVINRIYLGDLIQLEGITDIDEYNSGHLISMMGLINDLKINLEYIESCNNILIKYCSNNEDLIKSWGEIRKYFGTLQDTLNSIGTEQDFLNLDYKVPESIKGSLSSFSVLLNDSIINLEA